MFVATIAAIIDDTGAPLAITRPHAAVMIAGEVMSIAIAPVSTPRDSQFAFRPRSSILNAVLHFRGIVSDAFPN